MIHRKLLALLIASSFMLSGCFTLTMQVDSNYPVLVNQSKTKKGYFQEEDRVWYFLWGLVDSNPNVVNDMMRSHRSHTVHSLNVSTNADVLGAIVGLVTAGVVMSRVVRVEGHED